MLVHQAFRAVEIWTGKTPDWKTMKISKRTLIFIIIAVIGTSARIFAEKIDHFVLVKRDHTNVLVPFLVIIVKFTALTSANRIFLLFCHFIKVLSIKA